MIDDDAAARELWAAVLLQAVKDMYGTVMLQVHKQYLDCHRGLTRDAVAAWFMDPDPHSGFCCICRVLDLDPERIRDMIMSGPPAGLLTRAGLERQRFYSMALVH